MTPPGRGTARFDRQRRAAAPPAADVPGTDVYRALAGPGEAEPPKTLGSRFLGIARPVRSDAELREALARVRAEHLQATHVCWAARIGAPGGSGDGATPRTSDDGEPAGSAGLPILREIDRRGLSDTLAAVVRDYGGTKLGTGGLVRAYGEAAGLALDAAPAADVVERVPLALAFAFADTSAAMRLLARFDAEVEAQTHAADGTHLRLAVRRSHAGPLADAFVEATAGRGRVG